MIYDLNNKTIKNKDTIRYLGIKKIGGSGWFSDGKYIPLYKYSEVYEKNGKLYFNDGITTKVVTPETVLNDRIRVIK